jgi:hypothetical protein
MRVPAKQHVCVRSVHLVQMERQTPPSGHTHRGEHKGSPRYEVGITNPTTHLIHHKVHPKQLEGVGQGHETAEVAPEGVDDVRQAFPNLLRSTCLTASVAG